LNKKKDKQTFEIATSMMADIRKTFSTRMKSLGLSQTQLAKRMGKTRSNVAVLMTQPNIISLPVIIDFCKALDLDFQISFREREPSVSVKLQENNK